MSDTETNIVENTLDGDKTNIEQSVEKPKENKTEQRADNNDRIHEEVINSEQAIENEMDVTEESEQIKMVEIGTIRSIQMESIAEEKQTKIDEEKVIDTTIDKDIEINVQKQIDGPKEIIKQNENVEEKLTESIANSNDPKDTLNDDKMDTQDNNKRPSTGIASNKETAKAIGSLGLLIQYASSSDEDEDSSSDDDADSDGESDSTDSSSNNESSTNKEKELNTLANNILNNAMSRENYRDADSDSSDTDSDDSDVEYLGSVAAQTIDMTNDEDIQEFLDACENNSTGPIKTKGELGMDDLPPIAELTITVAESECVELGKISGIVDTLVLVESVPGFAAVDLDTVLFLDKGNRTLGQVFDVMGNVASPIYCVRFNSTQDIVTKNITIGFKVYVAPQTEYTNFIVLSDLMKEKGCDASWENDNEAPDDCNEFSDDEEERLNRRKQNQRQRNKNRTIDSSEQLSNKIAVKVESNANHRGKRSMYNNHRPRNADKQPTRFYKDNRGYANVNHDSSNFYQQQYPQRMQPQHNSYSWHTAAMHSMPTASSSVTHPIQFQPSYGSNVYPNPFAMQPNYVGPFNLQAFPPLPPVPMNSIPPHHQPPQLHPPYNRKK